MHTTFKYDLRSHHPRLFGRFVTPIEEIPVFYNGKVQCLATMNDLGHFYLSVSDSLARRLSNGDAFIEAEWTEAYVTPPEDSPGPLKLVSLRVVDVPFLY